ncbi:hypothetical protein FUAX_43160 (plasmid) [Fulvitalea axinellae]|uniref:Uncharacterized protein n=2 Tax=Fulvitalea axinellae TaxID=1182444 RepID=A0AAU9DBF2_9BACT|nr:hypothetical protein FUAX_43160 [Fulvitalea axinellae]
MRQVAEVQSAGPTISCYDVREPAAEIKMPNSLEEVSGIAHYKGDTVVMVQDEKGFVYFYDLSVRAVVKKEHFYKAGDYEGVTVVGDDIYVTNSKGDIFFFDARTYNGLHGNVQQTRLTKDHNVEGLTKLNNDSLLVALKGSPKKKALVRNVYSFDLKSKKMSKEPYLVVDPEEIAEFIGERRLIKPSGVAVHPLTGDIYILAHIGKVLAVYDRDSRQLKQVQRLSRKQHRQPEGICFMPNGDMLIANEGDGKHGRVYIYDYLCD